MAAASHGELCSMLFPSAHPTRPLGEWQGPFPLSEGTQRSLPSSACHTLLPDLPPTQGYCPTCPQHLLMVSGWPVDSFLFRSGGESKRRLRVG